MSSFIRRIQRQVISGNPAPQYEKQDGSWHYAPNGPRKKHFQGRGNRLGVKNSKCACLLARLKREARNSKRKGL